MAQKLVVSADGQTLVDLTPAEQAQILLDQQAAAASKATRDAETARIATYDADASVSNRAAFLSKLTSMNATDLETFVRGYINATAVVDLASAELFAKRVENAIVVLTKMLVKAIQN